MAQHIIYTNTTVAEQDDDDQADFDSNLGFGASSSFQTSTSQAWMWKRHAGLTVCTWKGDGVAGRQIAHDMNKIPEMMWVKARTQSSARDWQVYHKGLNGGSNPEQYNLWLNRSDAENDSSGRWNDTAPTSTHFTIGGVDLINESSYDYIAMLFASTDVSAVGSYTGNGSTTGPVITTGFAPRLIMIKRSSGDGDWYILDTVRGLTSSSNKLLKLNDNDAQSTPSSVYVEPSSTGFQLKVGYLHYNSNNEKYIYYAHA